MTFLALASVASAQDTTKSFGEVIGHPARIIVYQTIRDFDQQLAALDTNHTWIEGSEDWNPLSQSDVVVSFLENVGATDSLPDIVKRVLATQEVSDTAANLRVDVSIGGRDQMFFYVFMDRFGDRSFRTVSCLMAAEVFGDLSGATRDATKLRRQACDSPS
ncbi:hypothetical protein AB3Y40_11175 [Yoonia sp. R2331]|uniref:hypothetical protein n=1 Tax=Yoonia sp. R2331 TaxID=3237238 RepID=UPI0034E3A381